MSLDLYIKTSTPVIKRGTGVYVREDGKTKELKTMAEVKERFPDAEANGIVMPDAESQEDIQIFKDLIKKKQLWNIVESLPQYTSFVEKCGKFGRQGENLYFCTL